MGYNQTTITKPEMIVLLGKPIAESLYRMCLQKFSTVHLKRSKNFLNIKSFRVENLIKFMGLITPRKQNPALWQKNKVFIEKELKRFMDEC